MELPTGCTWLESVAWSQTVLSSVISVTVISEYRLHINYISTVINVWGQIYMKRAGLRATERPTEILWCCTVVTFIIEFAMIIWGSVVVFGAWASWTWRREEYNNNTDDMNFCEYTPMVFAFALLIFKWVSSMNRAIDQLELLQ